MTATALKKKPKDLSTFEVRLLNVVARMGGAVATTREMAVKLATNPGRVSQGYKALFERGFVAKDGQGYHVTEAGQRFMVDGRA